MLGMKIHKLRKEHGMTQAQLAEKLDICRQTVMKWEKGIKEPDIESVQVIAELYNVSSAQLLDPYTDDDGIMEVIHSYTPFIDSTSHRAVSGYIIDSGKRAGIPHGEAEVIASDGRCITKMTADESGFFIGSTGSEKQYAIRFRTDGMTYELPKIRACSGETYLGGIDLSVIDPEPALPAEGIWGGNIAWRIDEDGVMTLSGRGEMEDRFSALSGKKERSPYRHLVKKVVIRSGITSIGAHAFDAFIHLESVTIGRDVARIRVGAFMGCKKLKTVNFGSSRVEEIQWDVFRGCVSLTRVNLPDAVLSVGAAAFAGCVSLTAVTLPDTAAVYDGAFMLCGNLRENA